MNAELIRIVEHHVVDGLQISKVTFSLPLHMRLDKNLQYFAGKIPFLEIFEELPVPYVIVQLFSYVLIFSVSIYKMEIVSNLTFV